jgi:predicted dithiol-disulfide oxidoreductase (DUF899 family)
MGNIKIVSKEEWEIARRKLLIKEKGFTKYKDLLSKERQKLPWVKVEKDYIFKGTKGQVKLIDLFEGQKQLIIYHFMFSPNAAKGCSICSFWADNFNSINIHLNHRNINMVVVSRAPIEKLVPYQEKMRWNFKWYSSYEGEFNFDYHVSIIDNEANDYDASSKIPNEHSKIYEVPGVSVFIKNEQNEIFHTYSTYGRGLDILNGAYNYIDLTPLGRDEKKLPFAMDWVRRHDEYEL